MGLEQMAFWSLDQLDLMDPLNEEIWIRSPEEQESIQPYRDNWAIGETGAQQAMRHPHRLPWVPDIVGRDWRSREALTIFGSAYGAFVGREGRPGFVSPAEYARASSAAEFTKLFAAKVLPAPYYSRIARLASAVVPSCRLVGLLDVCRVAFVRCLEEDDEQGDRVVQCAPELFVRYIESPTANDWLWRRIVDSEAETVVALGLVAEHGVLRLFGRNLQEFSIRDSRGARIQFAMKPGDHRWPLRYAHSSRKLRQRIAEDSPSHWDVEGRTSAGTLRTWRVVVVPHPAARWSDPTYPARALRAACRPLGNSGAASRRINHEP